MPSTGSRNANDTTAVLWRCLTAEHPYEGLSLEPSVRKARLSRTRQGGVPFKSFGGSSRSPTSDSLDAAGRAGSGVSTLDGQTRVDGTQIGIGERYLVSGSR